MNKPIKILMVMGNTRMGGAQAFILNILRNIDRSKYQIDFAINFFAEHDGIESECKQYGCQFYILPYFKVVNFFHFYKAWDTFIKNSQYDIVYAHSTNSASIFLSIAKKYGINTIAHSHSAGFRGGVLERLTKKVFAKGVGNVADYWFACSDKAAERLYGEAYKSYADYYNIPNAIEAEKYAFNSDTRERIRKQIGVSDDIFLCGHLGTFSAVKNHKFLIEVFAEIVKKRPKSKLVCCGAGALMDITKQQVRNLGLTNNVIFTGVVNNANEFMMAMDCFIFPSIFEGFPVSVLEAQATGLPVIMHEVISAEVDLTNLVRRVSLKQPASLWANIALETQANDRLSYNKAIANSCYNIQTSIKQLEYLFTKLVEK